MIQVIEAMPWVRCASGNVLFVGCARGCFWIKEKLILVKEFLSGKSRMSLWRKIKQQRHSQAIHNQAQPSSGGMPWKENRDH